MIYAFSRRQHMPSDVYSMYPSLWEGQDRSKTGYTNTSEGDAEKTSPNEMQ